jgi:hypothetical protein
LPELLFMRVGMPGIGYYRYAVSRKKGGYAMVNELSMVGLQLMDSTRRSC